MATLTSGITASQRKITVTTPGSPIVGGYYRIDDELIRLLGYWKGIVEGTVAEDDSEVVAWAPDTTCWYVERGTDTTPAVAHDAGDTVEAWVVTTSAGGEGGGLTNPVTETLTVEQPDPTTATLVVVLPEGSEDDGTNAILVEGETGEPILQVDPYGTIIMRGPSGDPSLGGGGLTLLRSDGSYQAIRAYADNGSGRALIQLLGGSSQPITFMDDDGTVKIGVFGASEVAQPVVPALATAQDIVDALVLLGWVAQAS